jgi:hypothetical protein
VIREDLFYCLVCGLVVSAQPTDRIFRTGFYRSEMRIGVCGQCRGKGMTEIAGPVGRSGWEAVPAPAGFRLGGEGADGGHPGSVGLAGQADNTGL